jgi:hypothetical protein
MSEVNPTPPPLSENKMTKLTGMVTNETFIVILILVVMCVIIIIIFVIVSMLRSNKMKSVILHTSMITLNNKNVVPYKVEAEKLPSSSNGQEFSYSMWLFLANNYDQTSNMKIILQRGNTSDSKTNISALTNPIIVMDKSTNRMYIGVSTNATNVDFMDIDTIFKRDAVTKQYTSGYLVGVIDYIPLQRWVNIVIAVKDINMNIYIDGDLYTIATTNDIRSPNSDVRPMIRGNTGEVVIGDKVNTVPGHLSLTQYYNYSLSHKEVRKIYKNGPVKSSWLSIFGLGNYGVRSPIYEIK